MSDLMTDEEVDGFLNEHDLRLAHFIETETRGDGWEHWDVTVVSKHQLAKLIQVARKPPEGYALVPIELSPAMAQAWLHSEDEQGGLFDHRIAYKAMIAAAQGEKDG